MEYNILVIAVLISIKLCLNFQENFNDLFKKINPFHCLHTIISHNAILGNPETIKAIYDATIKATANTYKKTQLSKAAIPMLASNL